MADLSASMSPLQLPPLQLSASSRSGDIRSPADFAGSFDSSGFTVNFKTNGNATGAAIARAAAPSPRGASHVGAESTPLALIVAGLIALVIIKKA